MRATGTLADWIGRSEERRDVITAAPLAAWSAMLDRDCDRDGEPQPGSELPPLAHWLYFLPRPRASEIGADGHSERGGFLPPVALPRRMWAGGRLEFHHPLRVGDAVTRVSRIVKVEEKAGGSGALVFVTVRHEICNPNGIALSEEHDIVYREAPRGDTSLTPPQPAPADEQFASEIVPDAVLLFRYSALTFNGHRIHYDRPYAMGVEGYPGLVVHGPLIATLLVDLLRRERPGTRLRRFAFTALRPTFDCNLLRVCGRADPGRPVQLWARDPRGLLAMQAEADLE